MERNGKSKAFQLYLHRNHPILLALVNSIQQTARHKKQKLSILWIITVSGTKPHTFYVVSHLTLTVMDRVKMLFSPFYR